MFEKIEMYEECIECLAVAGHQDRATKLAEERLKIEETPKLLCIYGELTNDISHFKKAW